MKLRVPCYSQSGVSDQDRNRFVDPTPSIIVRDIFTALSILLLDPNFFKISEFACNCGTKHVQTYNYVLQDEYILQDFILSRYC